MVLGSARGSVALPLAVTKHGVILTYRLAILLFAGTMLSGSVSASAAAPTMAEPGDTGSLELPVRNSSESVADMEGVQIDVASPPSFIVTKTTPSGPQTIPPGTVRSFTVFYEISPSASCGDFDVTLTVKTATGCCIPKPPGGTWEVTHSFSVRSFGVTVLPPMMSVGNGETKSHTISIQNRCSEDETFYVAVLPDGTPNWTVSGPSADVVGVGAGNTEYVTFDVSNCGACAPVNILVAVYATTWGITKTPENLDASADGYIQDHPDETYDISNPDYPTPWKYDSGSHVGILGTGWGEGLGYLLGRYDVATCLVKPDLTILNEPDRDLDDLKILLVGSAGFAGLDSSERFKQKLADYVSNGGALIMLTQQHGMEFSALPAPEEEMLTGYGWSEDQSCHSRAVYIDSYHVMFAGQDSAVLDASVDGYFLSWPASATILLRRTKNGMPAMIAYDYGQGKVIACTLYSDWAYGHAQLAQDELRLIRDLMAWADEPADIPEWAPGDAVDFQLTASNRQAQAATGVLLTAYEPDRSAIATQEQACLLPPGAVADIDFVYTAPSILGIYRVNYALEDASGIIQAEAKGARFAVSRHYVYVEPPAELSFSVSTADENLLEGSDATFLIRIWNNGDTGRTITVKSHWLNEASKVMGAFWVPAYDSLVVPYTYHGVYGTRGLWWFWARFYDEEDAYLGVASVAGTLSSPSVQVEVQTDKSLCRRGETLVISWRVENRQAASYAADQKITVLDPNNAKAMEQIVPVNLPGFGSATGTVSYTLPISSPLGVYVVRADAMVAGRITGSATAFFEVPGARLLVTPVLPEMMIPASSNPIGVAVENVGSTDVGSAGLTLRLVDPNAATLWTEQAELGELTAGETVSLDFSIPLAAVEFGTYRLEHVVSYDGRTTKGVAYLPSAAEVELDFDKSVYAPRQDMDLMLSIRNAGRFREDLTVLVEVPDCGVARTSAVTVAVGDVATIHYGLTIPETIPEGRRHSVIVTLAQGSSLVREFCFFTPQSEIVVGTDKLNYSVGEPVVITIENVGGEDTEFGYSVELRDTRYRTLYQGSATNAIPAGSAASFSFTIPGNAVDGRYVLVVNGTEQLRGEAVLWQANLLVAGWKAWLSTETEEEVYLNGETVSARTTVTNLGTGMDADLRLQVLRQTLPPGLVRIEAEDASNSLTACTVEAGVVRLADYAFNTQWGSWGSGDGQFYWPRGIAIDSGTNVYVADCSNHRIQKFSSDGTFITKWGTPGSGDGQFGNYPFDVAVDSTGNVYVADRGRHRIQKFSSDGTFIMKWGSYGSGDGQFGWPTAIAVDNRGDVYVADGWNHRVQKFDSDGTFITKWGAYGSGDGQFVDARGVAVDSLCNVYVVDQNCRVQKFAGDGRFVMTWGSEGSGDGQFWMTDYVAVDGSDHVYVADGSNQRVQKFDSDGTFITKWGSFGSGDGQFNNPYGIAVDSACNAYVVDCSAHRVQKFRPPIAGTVETPWIQIGRPRKAVDFVPLQSLMGGAIVHEYKTSEADAWHPISEMFGVTLDSGRVKFRSTLSRALADDPSPLLDRIDFSHTWDVEDNILWEEDRVLTLAEGGAVDIASDIGILNAAGKLCLQATLTSDSGQTIAQDAETFYIADDNLALTIDTDKTVYKPGEVVTVTGAVLNISSAPRQDVALVLKKGDDQIYAETFDLPAGGAHGFVVSTTADMSFVLSGSADGAEAVHYVEVAAPLVGMSVSAPEVAGHSQFSVDVLLENFGNLAPAELTLNVAGRVTSLTLSPRESRLIQESLAIDCDTSIAIALSGDKEESVQRTVLFGEKAVLYVTPDSSYPARRVSIPFVLMNNGALDTDVEVTFAVSGHPEQTKAYYLPRAESLSDRVLYDLQAGVYVLTYTVRIRGTDIILDAGGTIISVSDYNYAVIDALTVHADSPTPEGNLLVDVAVRNRGFNDFDGRLRLSTGFDEEDIELSLAVGQANTVTFAVPISVAAGSYEAKAEVIYGGLTIDQKSQSFDLAPKFIFSSVPTNLVFVAGEQAVVPITVKNIGTAEGLAEVRLTAGDIVDETRLRWIGVNEETECVFNFVTADDLETKDYPAIALLNGGNQVEMRLSIRGYAVDVEASLDKKLYEEGDTARLTLKVTNLSDLTALLFGAAMFNEYEGLQAFVLPAAPRDIDAASSPGDVSLASRQEAGPVGLVAYDGYNTRLIYFAPTNGAFAYVGYSSCTSAPATYNTDGIGLAAVDINGDGLDDLLAYDGTYRRLLHFINNADGSFIYQGYATYSSAPASYRYSGVGLEALDVNGDGLKDLLAYDGYYRRLIRFTNNGDGTFAYAGYASYSSAPATYYDCDMGLAAVDFNGDGFLDLTAYDGTYRRLLRFANNGAGSFTYDGYISIAGTPTFASATGIGLAAVDLNDDGLSDVVAYDGYYKRFLRFVNRGDRSFDYTGYTDFPSAPASSNRNGVGLAACPFSLVSRYAPTGVLVSTVYDAGEVTEGGTISWISTEPAGTAIRIETRTSSDITIQSAWSGWAVQSNGSLITSPSNRYIQYRATLTTTDSEVSPILHDITIAAGTSVWTQTSQEDFATDSCTLEFDVPVTFIGYDDISYGIYLASGRSLYLDSIPLRERQDVINLWTDKDVYEAGDTVAATVESQASGLLAVTAPGYMAELALDIGTTGFAFCLPEDLRTAAYSIDYSFGDRDYSYSIGVIGYAAAILGCSLDRSEYKPGETMTIDCRIDANQDMTCVIQGWVRDAKGKYTDCFKVTRNLAEGETAVRITGNMLATNSGSARLVYGIYKPVGDDEYGLVLAAGSEAFDVVAESDEEPPAITIVHPQDGLITSADVVIEYEVSDNVTDPARIVVTGDESPYTQEGTYSVTLVATDEAGNSATAGVSFTIDKTEPVLTITSPQDGLITKDDVTLAYTVSDNVSTPADISVTGDDSPYTDDGQYDVTLVATDEAGNSASASVSFMVDKTAPVADAGPDQTVNEGDVVVFDAFASHDPAPGSGIDAASYAWDFGDPNDPTSGSGVTVEHTYGDDGSFTVTLTLSDVAGNVASDTANVTIANVGPSIEVGEDQTADENSLVNFLVTISDPGWLDSFVVTWNFGDGASTSRYVNAGTAEASHAYEWPDVYEVIVTVVDDDAGQAVGTVGVTVQDAAAPNVALIAPSSEGAGVCRIVNGTIPIYGMANDLHPEGSHDVAPTPDNFAWLQLAYAPGMDATNGWQELTSQVETNSMTEPAVLALWDTAELAGYYTLRLSASEVEKEDLTTKPNTSEARAVVYVGEPEVLFSFGEQRLNKPSYLALVEVPDNDGPDVVRVPDGRAGWLEVELQDTQHIVLVSDRNNDVVAIYVTDRTPQGTSYLGQIYTPGAKGKGSGLNKPSGIAVQVLKRGDVEHRYDVNLYVADQNNDRVLRITPDASVGLGPGAGFNKPAGIALDYAGNVFVSDRNNDRLVILGADGSMIQEMMAGLNKPDGVDVVDLVDAEGQLLDVEVYVADRNNDRLVKLDAQGKVAMTVGSAGSGRGQFNKPAGVYVNSLGYIYVTDTNNDRLQKFDQYGNCVMVFAPQGGGASLNKPVGVALDASGQTLYVVDQNNDRVVVFGLPEE